MKELEFCAKYGVTPEEAKTMYETLKTVLTLRNKEERPSVPIPVPSLDMAIWTQHSRYPQTAS